MQNFSPPFGSVILLIRNPYDAMISEWNRRNSKTGMGSSHVRIASQDKFGKHTVIWKDFM